MSSFNYNDLKDILSSLHSSQSPHPAYLVPLIASNIERDSNHRGVICMDKVIEIRMEYPDVFAKMMLIVYLVRLRSHKFNLEFKLSLLDCEEKSGDILLLKEIAEAMQDKRESIIELADSEGSIQERQRHQLQNEMQRCSDLLSVLKAYNERAILRDDLTMNWVDLKLATPYLADQVSKESLGLDLKMPSFNDITNFLTVLKRTGGPPAKSGKSLDSLSDVPPVHSSWKLHTPSKTGKLRNIHT